MDNRERVRSEILQILFTSVGYEANQESIRDKLAHFGFSMLRYQLVIELSWLDSADLIVDRVVGGVHIASLTGDGIDCAEGLLVIDGVLRPRKEGK